ncbi:9766_t:CDS:2 [Funneliformis geosporum]|uniref:13657_t:CDS:1 n=1 Tax=Funneliformis geosporum TaxID=1117311 RepID=A0A9W4SUN5_9GLOM|nr:13657_t:CDS:2 [Funneliformis geosporum]CAI2186530.1 9766_t:CDS:2 [Funneliformis geosporum]
MGIYYNHEYSSWKFHRNVLIKSVTFPKFLKGIVMELQEQFKELENYWDDMETVESEPKYSNDQNSLSNDKAKDDNKKHDASINASKSNGDKIIDISKWINRFTFDIFLQSITRKKSFSMANYFNQISKDEENKLKGIECLLNECNQFINKLKNSLWLLDQFNFVLIGLPKWFEKIFLVYKLYNRKYFKDYWWLYETLLKIVQTRRFEISCSPKEPDLKADLLTSLINFGTSHPTDVKSENERALTDEEIVSNSFSYIIYYICKYPTIKYRMIEEIDSILGNHHDTFTYFMIGKLYFCEAVIKEVLRIHPVHPLISRVLNEKDNVGGFTWNLGQMFFINLHAIQNHKYNWKNPDEFNPERFLYLEKEEEEKVLNKNENHFIKEELERKTLFAFGMGVRSCPAKDLAMIMLKTMVVMFLRKYDVILVDQEELQINYENMLNICDELKVKIRSRNHK